MRARAIPTNPGTSEQQAIRSNLATLAAFWSSTLSQAQRDGWAVYAANVPVFNALGQAINLSGQQMYIRSNTALVQTTLSRIDDAPTIFDLGPYTPPVVGVISSAADTFSMAFDNTDAWANEDDAAMLFYISRPQNPGITYFKGPYQFAGEILGNATTAPTSPTLITSPFDYTAGQRGFWRATVARADGRYSSSSRGTGLAT
jgi:hypothetical protein